MPQWFGGRKRSGLSDQEVGERVYLVSSSGGPHHHLCGACWPCRSGRGEWGCRYRSRRRGRERPASSRPNPPLPLADKGKGRCRRAPDKIRRLRSQGRGGGQADELPARSVVAGDPLPALIEKRRGRGRRARGNTTPPLGSAAAMKSSTIIHREGEGERRHTMLRSRVEKEASWESAVGKRKKKMGRGWLWVHVKFTVSMYFFIRSKI